MKNNDQPENCQLSGVTFLNQTNLARVQTDKQVSMNKIKSLVDARIAVFGKNCCSVMDEPWIYFQSLVFYRK